jgi:hypothetical protein
MFAWLIKLPISRQVPGCARGASKCHHYSEKKGKRGKGETGETSSPGLVTAVKLLAINGIFVPIRERMTNSVRKPSFNIGIVRCVHKQFSDGPTQRRMFEIGCQLGKWFQNKAALMQTRVGKSKELS